MTSNSETTARTTAGQSGPQRGNSRITATAAPQRENSGITAGQQQDKPNNSRTTRTTARQQLHNSGTTWTTTRFLFSFLTRDVSHNIRSPRSHTTFEGASPSASFAGRAWRKSLGEHGLHGRMCGTIYIQLLCTLRAKTSGNAETKLSGFT